MVPPPVSDVLKSGGPLRSLVAHAVMVPVIVNVVVKLSKAPSEPGAACGATNGRATMVSEPLTHA